MMQHLATAKSEIAAFASGAEQKQLNIQESAEDFGKVLQDQTASPSRKNDVSAKSGSLEETKAHKGLSKDEVEAPLARDKQKALTTDEKNTIADTSEIKRFSKDLLVSGVEKHTEGKEKPETKADDTSPESDQIYISNVHQDRVALTVSDPEQATVDSGKNLELALTSESTELNHEAQEWVALVENLQKLAEPPLNQKGGELTESEGVYITPEVALDSSKEPITLPSYGQEFPVKLAGSEALTLKKLVKEETGASLAIGGDDYTAENIIGLSEKLAEKAAVVTSLGESKNVPFTNNLTRPTVKAVQQALADANIVAGEQLSAELGVPKDAVQGLLDQPKVLQELLVKLHTPLANNEVLQNKGDATTKPTGEVNSLNTPELAGALTEEIQSLPDLTDEENIALLRALLSSDESKKTQQFSPQTEASKTKGTANPNIALETTIDSALDNKLTDGSAAIKSSDGKPTENILESVLQSVQALESAERVKKTEKTDNTGEGAGIKFLVGLSDDKLEKALSNIAERIVNKSSTIESVAAELVVPRNHSTLKSADVPVSNDPPVKELVATLKSAVEEFKSQLSQGREPGIDLKSMVSEALDKTSNVLPANSKANENVEQAVKRFSQIVDFAHTLNQATESSQSQVANLAAREVAQIQGEQTKQIQLNQFESKFEKAINIAKPDGHQQLAEKVRWMVNTKNLVAEIRLDPAELGSVQVKVAVSGESASVNFVVQSQQARDAMDNATPRLREMLAEKGIELGQSSVRQESEGKQNEENGNGEGGANKLLAETEESELEHQVVAQQKVVNGALGGIDYFV